MQISPIQNLYKINFSLIKQQKIQQSFTGDTFVRSNNPREKLYDGKNFKIENFYKLTPKERKEIFERPNLYDDTLQKDVEKNYKVAKLFKEYLDEQYGENNYVFECIGTSPASIGRFLEFSGVEVHYLPITHLNMLLDSSELNKKDIKEYGKFLTSQGIDKNMLKKTNKTHLFYDYTASGRSLRTFKKLLEREYKIPTNSPQIEFRSLNDDLSGNVARTEKGKVHKDSINAYIDYFLNGSFSEEYGGVPHLHWTELSEIKNIVNKDAFETERYFNFFTMYKLNEEGLLKENPANKVSL